MWYESKKEDPELELCVLDETIPPCRECEKHFFHQQQTFNLLEAGVVVVSILTLVTDIVTDALVTCQYFASGEHSWGLLTLSFMLLPSLCIQFFSIRWYQVDEDLSTIKWIVHGLQLGPLYRYFIVLQTGMMAKKSQDPLDFDLLYHQQSDVCMLRLFESFLESAPQVVLQLYIMVATNEENFFTGISAMVSIVSLCWAIAVYSRIHRRVREDKKVVSWPGVVLQAVWRIGMISSRVIALVLFAAVFKAYVFLVIALHWSAMMVWVVLQNTDFCLTWLEERLFNAVIAAVYIFCFFNLKEGTSRYRVLAFYAVIFVENVLLLVLWNSAAEEKGIYTEVGFSTVFGGFFIGVTSMILYYRYLHPHASVGCCGRGSSKHQPCLQHDDVLIKTKHKGLEAEISPRSHTPSPCPPHLFPEYSPLALPISEFTTPASWSSTPGMKRLASVSSLHETTQTGRQVRSHHQRAKSESCLIQDKSCTIRENLTTAKSLCGLAKDTKENHQPGWVRHFVDERSSLTRQFFSLLTPDVLDNPQTADVASGRRSGRGKSLEPQPHPVSRVDSVSRKLLQGCADRRMHRSFRRQLRYEKDEGSVENTPTAPSLTHPETLGGIEWDKLQIPQKSVLKPKDQNGSQTGTPRVMPQDTGRVHHGMEWKKPPSGTPKAHQGYGRVVIRMKTPKDLVKLPEDNVRSKRKVFEALGMTNSSLAHSGSHENMRGTPSRASVKMGSTPTAKTGSSISERSSKDQQSAVCKNCSSEVKAASTPALKQKLSVAGDQSPIAKTGSSLDDTVQIAKDMTVRPVADTQPSNSSNLQQPIIEKGGSEASRSGNRFLTDNSNIGDCAAEEHVTVEAGKINVRLKNSSNIVSCSVDVDDKQRSPGASHDAGNWTAEEDVAIEAGKEHSRLKTSSNNASCSSGELDKHKTAGVANGTGDGANTKEQHLSERRTNNQSKDVGPKSPLSEIQPTTRASPRKTSPASTGKENQGRKMRESFGNVKIKDIKESIANSPKRDVRKSRMSFSRIPADIVAKRVSNLVSTPEQ